MSIYPWQVYHVVNCRHTTPRKDKFVVIACQDTQPGHEWCGFFINSRVNQFFYRNPRLLPCVTQILAVEHAFLAYDSWVSTKDVHLYTHGELNNLRGELSPTAIAAVRQSVQDCVVLPRRYKKLILG